MHIKRVDEILKQVSLLFGPEQVQHLIPENMLVDIGIFDIAHIDEANLESEPSKQAKLYIFFNYLLSYASSKLVTAEAELKKATSQAYSRIDAELEKRVPKERVTDTKIERLMETDTVYRDAVLNFIEYKNMTNTFKNIVEGLSGRGDQLTMLMSKRIKEQHDRT